MALNISGKATGSSSTGLTVQSSVMTVAPTIGDQIAVGVQWFNDTPLTVLLTDNGTGGVNTYTACGAALQGSTTDAIRWYLATVDHTNASFQVTATFSGDGQQSRIFVYRLTGGSVAVDLYGGQVQAPGIATTDGTTTGSLGTPSVDNCLVLAMSRSTSFPDTFSAGTGYTQLDDIFATNRTVSEYLVQTTKTGVAATFTQELTNATLTLAVVFKPTGGGSTAGRLVGGMLAGGVLVSGLLSGI